MYKTKKQLQAENEELKTQVTEITTQLAKKPEDLKADLEERQTLEQEIEENKKLLEDARVKEKALKADILGGSSVEKINKEDFEKTKAKLKGILHE